MRCGPESLTPSCFSRYLDLGPDEDDDDDDGDDSQYLASSSNPDLGHVHKCLISEIIEYIPLPGVCKFLYPH